MKQLLVIILLLFSVSCAAPAVVKYPDGTVIALGASVLEKTQSEAAGVQLPNGMIAQYQRIGKDQTGVANMAIATWGPVQGIIESGAALNEGERIREVNTTRRVISDNGVKKAKIAGDVAVKTFVPQ